ncbi:hypothetical protein SNEBB_000372 [Seison nebaliae]|nr:hypothetical protein SNEBB_000372 [Seison nebaliae]
MFVLSLTLFLSFFSQLINADEIKIDDYVVLTIATEKTDGFNQLEETLKHFNYNYKVLGLNEDWEGGDMATGQGGGQKINILKKELSKINKKNEKTVVLFVDGYDVVFVDEPIVVINKFKSFKKNVVFSAEKFCWPDRAVDTEYPAVANVEIDSPFLNSGAFIGYAKELLAIMPEEDLDNTFDDQRYYTMQFLNEPLRTTLNWGLDTTSLIFQNLNGDVQNIKLLIDEDQTSVQNTLHYTEPSIIHGNGPTKLELNHIGNYVGGKWSMSNPCPGCVTNEPELKDEELPHITIGVFVTQATPFMEEFFKNLYNLDYPKDKITLFIYNSMDYHMKLIEDYLTLYHEKYSVIKFMKVEVDMGEATAKAKAFDECVTNKGDCEYYFYINSIVHLENNQTIKHLLKTKKNFIAPVVTRPQQNWSNFWGSISENGYYQRSEDYLQIINGDRTGVWNVPFVNEVYLIKWSLMKRISEEKDYMNAEGIMSSFKADDLTNDDIDPDMTLCKYLREHGHFMNVINEIYIGFLVNPETYNISRTRPEMYEIFTNPILWQRRYIHKDYPKNFDKPINISQPCPDVYWFPVVSVEFTESLIDMAETLGEWSHGKHEDARLDGGYENVPTIDTHMKQLDWESHWLEFLRAYVAPVVMTVFTGYDGDKPRAIMNFIVRYKPTEQDRLRPHHDASTWTLNLSLNRKHLDFEGGGSSFGRFNCQVTETKQGWGLIHPGRLTHIHEGLPTTKGTRYIMVSFVDP